MAVFKPIMAAEVSRPDISTMPMKPAACCEFSPSSLSCTAFVCRAEASVSMSMPVACPVAFMASSRSPASEASCPKAFRTPETLSTEVETSVLFRSANLMNFPERSSSACPVKPKRVLTSPTAAPAVSKSVGISVARSLTVWFMSSKACPVAPVFCSTISRPESTSLKAAKEAAPTATIGAVTCVVSPSPTSDILPPTSCILLPACFRVAETLVSVFLHCCSRPFNSCSVAMISRCHASYCSCVTEPFFRPASI